MVEHHKDCVLSTLVEVIDEDLTFELLSFFFNDIILSRALSELAVLLEHATETLPLDYLIMEGEKLAVEIEEVSLEHTHDNEIDPETVQLLLRDSHAKVKAPV